MFNDYLERRSKARVGHKREEPSRSRAKKAGHKALRRRLVRHLRLSKLHVRLANIRKDAAHRLTTDLSRRFETIVIEDLNVSGMAQSHSLVGAMLDCGLHEIRRQFRYKQAMRGGVLADRFYPSTQICSCCGCLTGPKGRQEMHVEEWICSECCAEHTRATATPQSTSGSEPRLVPNQRVGHDTSTGSLRMSASVVDEPRTEFEPT